MRPDEPARARTAHEPVVSLRGAGPHGHGAPRVRRSPRSSSSSSRSGPAPRVLPVPQGDDGRRAQAAPGAQRLQGAREGRRARDVSRPHHQGRPARDRARSRSPPTCGSASPARRSPRPDGHVPCCWMPRCSAPSPRGARRAHAAAVTLLLRVRPVAAQDRPQEDAAAAGRSRRDGRGRGPDSGRPRPGREGPARLRARGGRLRGEGRRARSRRSTSSSPLVTGAAPRGSRAERLRGADRGNDDAVLAGRGHRAPRALLRGSRAAGQKDDRRRGRGASHGPRASGRRPLRAPLVLRRRGGRRLGHRCEPMRSWPRPTRWPRVR